LLRARAHQRMLCLLTLLLLSGAVLLARLQHARGLCLLLVRRLRLRPELSSLCAACVSRAEWPRGLCVSSDSPRSRTPTGAVTAAGMLLAAAADALGESTSIALESAASCGSASAGYDAAAAAFSAAAAVVLRKAAGIF
jgi:hypothetical protein